MAVLGSAAGAGGRAKAGEAGQGLVAGGDAGGGAAAGLGVETARLAGAEGAAVGADRRGAVLGEGALETQRSLVVVRRGGGHRAPREEEAEGSVCMSVLVLSRLSCSVIRGPVEKLLFCRVESRRWVRLGRQVRASSWWAKDTGKQVNKKQPWSQPD